MTDALLHCPRSHPLPLGNPADAGALGVLEKVLAAAGFTCHRVTFSEPDTSDIDNLYARIGSRRRTSPLPDIPTWCRPATKPHGRSARSRAK